MSHVNRGKAFEEQIKKGFESCHGTAVLRLIDPQAGYAGVHNICDFVVYKKPTVFFIECKSCYGNTLSINSNQPNHHYGDITDGQWDGLLNMSQVNGVVAGIMVWYIDHDKTFFVPIQLLKKLKDGNAKSLHFSIIQSIAQDESSAFNVLEIDAKKRRVLFDYDMTSFLHFYC